MKGHKVLRDPTSASKENGERSRKEQGEERRGEYRKGKAIRTRLQLGNVRHRVPGSIRCLPPSLASIPSLLCGQDRIMSLHVVNGWKRDYLPPSLYTFLTKSSNGHSEPTNPYIEKQEGHHYTSGTWELGREGEEHTDHPFAFSFFTDNSVIRHVGGKSKRPPWQKTIRAIVCDDNRFE